MPDQNIGFPTKGDVRQPGIDVDFTGHSASDPRLPGALALLGGSHLMAATGPLRAGPDIYQSIGVEPVINCRGTFTIIGASIELPEVRAAMDAAAQHYVQLDELAEGVGRRLAELTGAEWGMVSAGCAAGLKHVTAACVSGGNPEKLLRIPDLTGLDKTEVVAPRSSRSAYDHAIRNIGVKMITVDTPEELERALSSRTAMIYLTAGNATVSIDSVAASRSNAVLTIRGFALASRYSNRRGFANGPAQWHKVEA